MTVEATKRLVTRQPVRQRIPAGIWVLGFVSMLMDISSEMIHALTADILRNCEDKPVV